MQTARRLFPTHDTSCHTKNGHSGLQSPSDFEKMKHSTKDSFNLYIKLQRNAWHNCKTHWNLSIPIPRLYRVFVPSPHPDTRRGISQFSFLRMTINYCSSVISSEIQRMSKILTGIQSTIMNHSR